MYEQTRPSPVPSSQRLGNEAAVAAAQNAHPPHVLGVGSLSSVASAGVGPSCSDPCSQVLEGIV